MIRVVNRKHKADVWLFTNVEDREQLTVEMASRFYRWRWEKEGFFRTYKRTMKKVKLTSRTLRLVHREAEVSMLATQLLLCQGALAMPVATTQALPVMCSPRRVLLEIRRNIPKPPPQKQAFSERIAQAQRERRARTTPKEKRQWPRRKSHAPPPPPLILTLTDQQNVIVNQYFELAEAA